MTPEYEEYLMSEKWNEKRKQALERAQYRCQVCNSSRTLHVHHRTYARIYNEDIEDLTVLCVECHSSYHERKNEQKKKHEKKRTFNECLEEAVANHDQREMELLRKFRFREERKRVRKQKRDELKAMKRMEDLSNGEVKKKRRGRRSKRNTEGSPEVVIIRRCTSAEIDIINSRL